MIYQLEIATTDPATTRAAVEAGADRIELCANLGEGGTTPSYGHIRVCRENFTVPIFPIIRPRGGDFWYTVDEFQAMAADIRICKELGCDGVVLGLLLADGSLDYDRTARLVEMAYPLGVTFHRAFDRCKEPEATLEQLIGLGVERVLTSGQRLTAPEGASLIASLQQQYGGDIILMPGSGVRPENLDQLIRETGCFEYHTSLRSRIPSPSSFRHPFFREDPDSYTHNGLDTEALKIMKNILGSHT